MSGFLITLILLVLAAVLFLPRVGLVARWRQARRMAARFRREDALKFILKAEANRQTPTLEAVAGSLQMKPSDTVELLKDMASPSFRSWPWWSPISRRSGGFR